MKCALLVDGRNIAACSAQERPYVPSLFELGIYCMTDDQQSCPHYQKVSLSMKQDKNDATRVSL